LIIGNEAHGVSPEIAALADEKLYIPIKGRAESLNAAVAAGIMIYHFS
jgi:TrmH family RNA methyltransferase